MGHQLDLSYLRECHEDVGKAYWELKSVNATDSEALRDATLNLATAVDNALSAIIDKFVEL